MPKGERHDDFAAGNWDSAKHRACSSRAVSPVAERIRAELLVVAPWTAQGAFRAAVQAWAWSEAQAVLVRAYIDECGLLDDDGVPRPALALLDRVESRAGRLRDALGLTPRSWAALVVQLGSADAESAARGLASLKAVGRELAEGISR